MIVGKFPMPPEFTAREVPGADDTLTPVLFVFSSMNGCIVTPGAKRLGGGQTAIVFCFDWRMPPTPEDEQDVLVEIRTVHPSLNDLSLDDVIRAPGANKAERDSTVQSF